MRKVVSVGAAVLLLLAAVGPTAGASSNYSVHLDGATEAPPNASQATGLATFKLSRDGTSLSFKLKVNKLDNPVAAHIHLAPPDVNGPVVVNLFSGVPGGGTVSGVIATGTITAANLGGPLDGQPLSALVAYLDSGDAYVNVHTSDGVPPSGTGPGDLPGGEIRGNF